MAAPYAEKHFLEMTERERKARRLAKLAEPGRDAIEGFYPEEAVIPAAKGLRGAVSAAKELGKKGVRAVDMAMRPKVNNNLVDDMWKKNVGKGTYAVRNAFSPAEIEDIKKTGFMLPSPKEVASGRNYKWFTRTDVPGTSDLRVLAEKVPPNRAVRRKDVEQYNHETGEYEPLKKGGVVKAKKHRGDGIIKRGGTKGRFV